jgi:hypothetical protein
MNRSRLSNGAKADKVWAEADIKCNADRERVSQQILATRLAEKEYSSDDYKRFAEAATQAAKLLADAGAEAVMLVASMRLKGEHGTTVFCTGDPRLIATQVQQIGTTVLDELTDMEE